MPFTATKSITINAAPAQVWDALTNPEVISKYMYGTEVESDWQPGSPITFNGEWEGRPYEDKGTILEIQPEKLLKTTYFSPLSGLEDKPENYDTVTYELTSEGDNQTTLTVTQDNNSSEEAADKAEANWGMVMNSIKEMLEQS